MEREKSAFDSIIVKVGGGFILACVAFVIFIEIFGKGSSAANSPDWQDWKYLFPPDGTISKYNVITHDRPIGTQTEEIVYHYLPNNEIVKYTIDYDNSTNAAYPIFPTKVKYLLEKNQVFQVKPNGEKFKIFEKVELGKPYGAALITAVKPIVNLEAAEGNGSAKYQNCFIAKEKEIFQSVLCKDMGIVYEASTGEYGTSQLIESTRKIGDSGLATYKDLYGNEWEW